jgi:hypothetical protein
MANASTSVAISEIEIVEAVKDGDIDTLRQWAAEGVRVTTAVPLCEAVWRGRVNLLRLLVNNLGANVNQSDEDGWTPVLRAAKEGNVGVLLCLVKELGADVNLADEDGFSPVYMACQEGRVMAVQYLVKDLGADINKPNENGTSPLHVAASKGHFDVVKLCCDELQADISHEDDEGYCALTLAVMAGMLSTVQYLLEFGGADITQTTADGQSVWDLLPGDDTEEDAFAAMTSLLRVMVLNGDPPEGTADRLYSEHGQVVKAGARLRARLPAHLARGRALLDAHCPLIAPLRALVHSYEAPLTTEEAWATGLDADP